MDAIDLAGIVRNHLDFFHYGLMEDKRMVAGREINGRVNPLVRVQTSDNEEFEITIIKVK